VIAQKQAQLSRRIERQQARAEAQAIVKRQAQEAEMMMLGLAALWSQDAQPQPQSIHQSAPIYRPPQSINCNSYSDGNLRLCSAVLPEFQPGRSYNTQASVESSTAAGIIHYSIASF
jgi:hypothetical protein